VAKVCRPRAASGIAAARSHFDAACLTCSQCAPQCLSVSQPVGGTSAWIDGNGRNISQQCGATDKLVSWEYPARTTVPRLSHYSVAWHHATDAEPTVAQLRQKHRDVTYNWVCVVAELGTELPHLLRHWTFGCMEQRQLRGKQRQ
jgi:hypothetical protein